MIKAHNREHLLRLIEQEIAKSGNQCSLNHIDTSSVADMCGLFLNKDFNGDISAWNTSEVKNMSGLFANSRFNGDISKWDVSQVKNMTFLFNTSDFNGDISKWDVSSVTDMEEMFTDSKFTGDISGWNVCCLKDISAMFYGSAFKGDISLWQPFSLAHLKDAFLNCGAPVPYWATIKDRDLRNKAITAFQRKEKLAQELEDSSSSVALSDRLKIYERGKI